MLSVLMVTVPLLAAWGQRRAFIGSTARGRCIHSVILVTKGICVCINLEGGGDVANCFVHVTGTAIALSYSKCLGVGLHAHETLTP